MSWRPSGNRVRRKSRGYSPKNKKLVRKSRKIQVKYPCIVIRTRNKEKALKVAYAYRKRHPEAKLKFIGNPDDPHYKGTYTVMRKDGKCNPKLTIK